MIHDDPKAFIRANTKLRPVPHVPEIVLHVADEAVPLWSKTEEELGAMGLPPPFWAFAWAGGQGLARYVLDHPETVRGKRVLDLACGSGLVGIAACLAGGAPVIGADVDPLCEAAVALNSFANGCGVDFRHEDLLDRKPGIEPRFDVILVGDLFYEQGTAARALAFLEAWSLAGCDVLIGDPGRTYLPCERLRELAVYDVPVTRELEDNEIKRTRVYALAT
jgi:predicted nicotinamide N-methyase